MPRPYKPRYRRRLPHLQPREGAFFVTYRLHGSIPMALLYRWKLEKEKEVRRMEQLGLSATDLLGQLNDLHWRYFFEHYDQYLDHNANGPYWLSKPEVATAVVDSLHYCREHFFHLGAFCIMSNHVHLLLTLREGSPPLYDVLGRHKSFTGNVANKLLGREGAFWQHESFDHMVRDDKSFARILHYILENPVKAKLVQEWRDWPWTFCSPELMPEW